MKRVSATGSISIQSDDDSDRDHSLTMKNNSDFKSTPKKGDINEFHECSSRFQVKIDESMKNITNKLSGPMINCAANPFYFQSSLESFINSGSSLPSIASLEIEKYGFYRNENDILMQISDPLTIHNNDRTVDFFGEEIHQFDTEYSTSDKYTLCEEIHHQNSELLQR